LTSVASLFSSDYISLSGVDTQMIVKRAPLLTSLSIRTWSDNLRRLRNRHQGSHIDCSESPSTDEAFHGYPNRDKSADNPSGNEGV